MIRNIHYADSHQRFNAIYRFPDPWGLDSDGERFRFSATNDIILREFGTVASLLEIGCGEGLQSDFLSGVCGSLHGVDISSVAVVRARSRCRRATFQAVDIMAETTPLTIGYADLVVACEVLYYVKDVGAFLERISKLGRSCLITYHDVHEERLKTIIQERGLVKSEAIRWKDTRWIVVWWTNKN